MRHTAHIIFDPTMDYQGLQMVFGCISQLNAKHSKYYIQHLMNYAETHSEMVPVSDIEAVKRSLMKSLLLFRRQATRSWLRLSRLRSKNPLAS